LLSCAPPLTTTFDHQFFSTLKAQIFEDSVLCKSLIIQLSRGSGRSQQVPVLTAPPTLGAILIRQFRDSLQLSIYGLRCRMYMLNSPCPVTQKSYQTSCMPLIDFRPSTWWPDCKLIRGAPETHVAELVVFSRIVSIISFPTLTASGNRGAKYCWIFSNRSR
jgi:hypothetical protein